MLYMCVGSGGCATAPAPVGPAELELPRDRTGCLPFPGLFTLYTKADPAALGVHHYGRVADTDAPPESERGILYTSRAGFLDLAHLRNTIDWTRFCVDRVGTALARGDATLTLNGTNGSIFHLQFHYPADWAMIDPTDQPRFTGEVALRLGERLAYTMLVWHETASWFGDHTFVFDESPSAFTWDDVMSHAIGVRIAEMALRDRDEPFDAAATRALDEMLHALGAVGPEQTQQAVDAVEGKWWAGGRPLKRQLDNGLGSGGVGSGFVTPWLVPGLPFSARAAPQPFAVPDVRRVMGHDLSGFCTIRIEPRCAAAERMRVALKPGTEWIDVEHDLPLVLARMGQEMRQQSGDLVSLPWPPADGRPKVHAVLTPNKLRAE